MLKKNIKCVERLIITSSYGLIMLLLSVLIVLKKSVLLYKIGLPVTYQIVMSPDLNFLVAIYETHKCSKFCKQNIKVGKTNVSRCRFNFRRALRDSICIDDVENSLKSCNKIYYLKRNEKEVRVNAYNPLLLKLWHANMDLQYIADKSLSLTEYVTGCH
uniref:Uncharacterized protein n=1 Tax=Amphimedon queenslandica TaxID=400682 RepID=A0A1X7VG38_AMPQE